MSDGKGVIGIGGMPLALPVESKKVYWNLANYKKASMPTMVQHR